MKASTFQTRLLTLLHRWKSASIKYDENRVTIALRLLKLYRQRGFGPDSALKFGLARPEITERELSGCLNKLEMIGLQDQLNPKELIRLTEDKSRFYPYCEKLGIPVPKTFAVVTREGRNAPLTPGVSRAEWLRIVETLPNTFITKPAEGFHGTAVHAWTRTEGGFADQNGRVCSPDALYELLLNGDKLYDCFIVQERLENHPTLLSYTQSTGLQTVRIATLLSADGRQLDYMYAEWKLALRGNVTDNFVGGRTGNLTANIDLQTGIIGPAMTVSPDGVDMVIVATHPVTGRTLSGTVLPDWDRLRALVEASAPKLLPLRSIGWDIGITPNGPVVIEANRWWDPPNNSMLGANPPGVAENPLIEGVRLIRQAAAG